MYELPLFPLNTVLFPGMPLPLHIFEDRYKDMVAYCLRENRPFGVVLIEEGEAEGGGLARPHVVGCTAEIAQVETLDEGRMLIMTIGRERFRIVRLQYGKPYLVGEVEPAPLETEDDNMLEVSVEQLSPLVNEYLEILSRQGTVEFDPRRIPTEPVPLSYLAATLIQLPAEEKQHFLDMDQATAMMRALSRAYRREVSLMRYMPNEDVGIFSLN